VRGRDGSADAVGAARTAPSAVRLADLVRRTSPHVLVVGAGADALVAEPLDPDALLTPATRAAWQRWRDQQPADDAVPLGSATVGAVVLDAGGDLAAATSTGGVLGKWPGRVGDAPIVGAGTYADARVAISCTGRGEGFLRAVTAKGLATALAAGVELEAALPRALAEVRAHGGYGGLIVATADGRLAWAFDTSHMAVGWTDGTTSTVAVSSDAGVTVIGAPS
jgi:L-asparaginase / beta-aspartyl-peptidase